MRIIRSIRCTETQYDSVQRSALRARSAVRAAKALRAAVPMIPAGRLLVETDAPFLAPTPYRGQRNEPAYVVETAKVVAELRGESFQHVAAVSRVNTIEIFGLPLDA